MNGTDGLWGTLILEELEEVIDEIGASGTFPPPGLIWIVIEAWDPWGLSHKMRVLAGGKVLPMKVTHIVDSGQEVV